MLWCIDWVPLVIYLVHVARERGGEGCKLGSGVMWPGLDHLRFFLLSLQTSLFV